MPRLVIFGCGGFGREVLRLGRQCYEDVVFASDEPHEPVLGAEVIGPYEIRHGDELFIAIASPLVRRRISERFPHLRAATIKAATAVVGDEVEIGSGSIFCDFAMATACARVGRHFHGNIYSYVAHDCVVGDFVTFAPMVALNGNVVIEDDVTIGCGAKIRNGTSDKPLVIGRGAVIGMGAVVVKDVPPGVTVVGNPARPLGEAVKYSK